MRTICLNGSITFLQIFETGKLVLTLSKDQMNTITFGVDDIFKMEYSLHMKFETENFVKFHISLLVSRKYVHAYFFPPFVSH